MFSTTNILKRLKELLSVSGPDIAITQLSSELQTDPQKALEYVQNAIESFIKTKLLKAIVREIEANKPPLEKINVTDLTFPCLRHAYYSKIFREERRGRLPELLAVWIGVKLHETKIFEKSELELEYGGVYGRIDEYEDEILLEIKTTRAIPNKPYPHHVRQVSYYRVLLERNGYPVKFAIILYINVNSLNAKPFVIFFDQPLEEVEKEMMSRKEALERAIKDSKIPPAEPEEPWACDYCSFAYLCGIQEEPSSKSQQ